MRLLRALVAVFAALLVVGGLSACDDDALDDVDLPEVDAGPDEGGEAPPPDGPGGGDGGDGEATGGDDAAPAPADDHGPVGSLGPALLDPGTPRAQLEIDTSDGADLSGAARDALVDRLSEHGGKSADFAGGDTLPSRATWSNAQLSSVAREHRTTSSASGSVAVHVLVVSGEHENEGTLGVALDASTFAVFPDAVRGGVLGGLNADDVEAAVAVHELGHLFGLVDLTGEGAFHEDPDHPNHSENEDSVMFWAVETDAVSQVFEGPPPTTFDDADRREMERIRT